MRTLVFVASLASLTIAMTPAQGGIARFGNSLAASCYEAAESRASGRAALFDCDLALREEALDRRDRVATLVNRGIIRSNSNDLVGASRDFDAAGRLNPNEPEVHLNKGLLHLRNGETGAAIPLLTRAIEAHTRKPALAYFARALALEQSGRVSAAYADLVKARAIDPRWSEPAVELARYKVRRR